MNTYYLGLGSNIGDGPMILQTAIGELASHGSLEGVSSLYVTKAQDYEDQPNFHNCVIKLQCQSLPLELLMVCQGIEHRAGRTRGIPKGPRTLDIDILLMGDFTMNTNDLVIPHPRMHQRRFVLEPLGEISKQVVIPGINLDVLQLLEKTMDQAIYAKYESIYTSGSSWTEPAWNIPNNLNIVAIGSN